MRSRSRQLLIALLRTLFAQAGSRTGYLKLARESGLANNTIASEYVEQLSDLLAVIPSFQWDADRDVPLQRKPAKFHFINLSVALSFSPNRMVHVDDFKSLAPQEKSRWMEWLVARELFRRQSIAGVDDPEAIWFWASKEHEIDFVDSERKLYEVEVGPTGAPDFAWFPKVFPKRNIEQFLLSDGFPHPYPGQVEDPDVYNDYCRF